MQGQNADMIAYRMSTGFEAMMHLSPWLKSGTSWKLDFMVHPNSGGLGHDGKELQDWFLIFFNSNQY